jgi:hypothetical protein
VSLGIDNNKVTRLEVSEWLVNSLAPGGPGFATTISGRAGIARDKDFLHWRVARGSERRVPVVIV